MSLNIVVPIIFGCMMLAGVALKVFKDRDMSRRDGLTLAALIIVVLYFQVAVSAHYNESLNRISMVCTLVIALLIGTNLAQKMKKRLSEKAGLSVSPKGPPHETHG